MVKKHALLIGVLFGVMIFTIIPDIEVSISIQDILYLSAVSIWIGLVIYRNIVIKQQTIIYTTKYKKFEIPLLIVFIILTIIQSIDYFKENYRLIMSMALSTVFIIDLLVARFSITVTDKNVYILANIELIEKISVVKEGDNYFILIDLIKYRIDENNAKRIENLKESDIAARQNG